MADSDIHRADIDQPLVQYGAEECRQIAQQFPANGLPLLPYITPPPVIYKVYNISNPVGLQIESQGGLMAVEDPRKALEDQKREYKETQTDWSSDNDDEERRHREDRSERTSKETSKSTWVTRLKPMPEQTTCKRVDRVSRRIITRMEVLEEQGNWLEYDKFLETAIERHEGDHDILVRIVLEDVVAAYFREDFQGGYTSLQQADDLVQKVSDPAQQQAHRLYLKSALLRRQRRHEEAENINTLALQGLPNMKPGRDIASVWYNIAALKAQVLYECENSPDKANELYKEAVSAFENAIDHYESGLDAKDETCRNHLRRSHIRLAMVAVGCWYDGTSTSTNPGLIPKQDLQKAENSLEEVENNLWEGIPNRMRCSWYLAKSDLFRRRGKVQRATEMAEEALQIAKKAKGGFPSEVKFAEVRLGLLKRTGELNREETRVEEDAEDMAWLSPEESLAEKTEITSLPSTKIPYTLRQPGDQRASKSGEEIPNGRTTTRAQSAVLLMISILLHVLTAVLIHSLYIEH